ncbi:hypothetical protein ACLB2K_040301 [Fragaria x ananassa]
MNFLKARQAEAKRKKRAKASWKPVLNGFLKLNVDVSFLPQITHGGTGGVLRNNTGQFQAAFAAHTNSIASAKQVEDDAFRRLLQSIQILAIKEGLEMLKRMHLSNVIAESDCLEATVDIYNSQNSSVAKAGLIDDIRIDLNTWQSVNLSHS